MNAGSIPGDRIVPDPLIELAYAIEIEAEPAAVWPWIVQVGYHRAGWYIDRWWDRIEQQYFWPLLVPAQDRGTWQPPADRILPQYQGLKVGDRIPDGPPGTAYYEVVDLQPERALVLRATTHFKYMAPGFLKGTRFEPRGVWSWAFLLTPAGPGVTHLASRWRGQGEPRAFMQLLKPLIWLIDHFQQREILKGVKRRVEGRQN